MSKRMDILFSKSREVALHPPKSTVYADYVRLLSDTYRGRDMWERAARSMADAIVLQPVYIEREDRLIGRSFYAYGVPAEGQDPEFSGLSLQEIEEEFPEYGDFLKNQLVVMAGRGHIAWDWQKILLHGTEELKAQCAVHLAAECDQKAYEFYSGAMILLEALERWNDKHVAELERLGMWDMADICRRVPRYPARTFHEAVQAFHMQHLVVMCENPYGGNSPGRLDYYLWPYLEADLKAGRCTLEEARELIEELFVRFDERLYHIDTWVETLVVGGSYPNGHSSVNPLSYMMIETSMKYDIVHPAVYVRLPKCPPKDFVDLCAGYMREGKNRAQLLSDPNILQALIRGGVSEQDAVDYFCGGCMEVGIQGKTSDCHYNGYQNLAKFLELSMTGGYCLQSGEKVIGYRAKPLTAYTNFESFYADFIDEVRRLCFMQFQVLDRTMARSEQVRPSYLVSVLMDDCMAKGRNMFGGGARYADYGVSILGFANTVDSLMAIKAAVFEQRICAAETLLAAVKVNFEGFEDLRNRLLALPKYGQEYPEADRLAARLVTDLGEIFSSYHNCLGGRGKLVMLTFIWAPEAGGILGAMADGSLAGKPVAHGVTPKSSSMTKGITAAINSCTTISFDNFVGGASTMWDLDAAWASQDIIRALFLSFFEKGGQIFQGNVVDVQTLIDAQRCPEEHRGLIVRVGGFSARFVELSAALQEDIINRMRHAC